MAKKITNSEISKSKALLVLEYALLVMCLSVIALRTTFTEGPVMQSAATPMNLWDNFYSLSISGCLIGIFLLWMLWNIFGKNFFYRPTGLEIGLCLFCIAAAVSGFAASDKRQAITTVIVLISPLLCSVILVQILDCRAKVNLVLAVIAALGVVSAYQCKEQWLYLNDQQINFYQEDPNSLLDKQEIASGTLQHWMFEHRLYSKPVQGFFTTSNSAGSFALLAFFAAIILFIDKLKNIKSEPLGIIWPVTCGLAVAAIFFGLIITRSKGAIIASFFAGALFVAYFCFHNRLKNHKKKILILCFLFALVAGSAIVWYGLTNGRLPGGNSMLVRWQYWQASAKMYADNPVSGVGPGNFAHFYTHYKPASAPESVSDPHNFLLSILTQYGPIGLIGFLMLIFVPLWTILFTKADGSSKKKHECELNFKKLAIILAIIVSLVLLYFRPKISPLPPTSSPQEKAAGIIVLYVIPVIVFIIGFLLVAAGRSSTKKPYKNLVVAVLFCAVSGVILHNLIDFAIFEPGVYITFWAIIACLIATYSYGKAQPYRVFKFKTHSKALLVLVSLSIAYLYFAYAVVPVAKSTSKIQEAYQVIPLEQFTYDEQLDAAANYAHTALDAAAMDDMLSPAALSLNGRLYIQHFTLRKAKDRQLLIQSEQCFLAAIERDKSDFKNHERLVEVYLLLSEQPMGREQTDWLTMAFSFASDAVGLYPGCGRLHFTLATIAEKIARTDVAIEQYKDAIKIEDQFRAQFRQMYPEKEEIVSRLGEEKYKIANERIKELSGESEI
ncbi:MAG: O-antigen ligase family protein [Sedimentisphaerales bacterium]|nr:O-antigen ligase family protein [Sedimentisphaerales bacterium]